MGRRRQRCRQVTQYFYVRYGSSVSVSGYRCGASVYLRAHAVRYDRNANYGLGGWSAFTGRTITFQYRYAGSSTWHTAGYATTGSAGYTAYKRFTMSKRYWRLLAAGNATIWNATSGQLLK